MAASFLAEFVPKIPAGFLIVAWQPARRFISAATA
jgi:hypothetical protein